MTCAGLHVLLYRKNNADADRTFFPDILGFRAIDVGDGWLIFRTPLYFMCDDLRATTESLAARNM